MVEGTIHCHVSNVSRKRADGTEWSVVAKAAYNSASSLQSLRHGRVFSFNDRTDVSNVFIFTPPDAPDWCQDRAQLWNQVEQCAKRKDARLAKSIEATFSREISSDERAALIERFVAPFLEAGIVVDVAIHEDGTNHNPHVHFLLTTQELLAEGFGKKLAFIDSKKFLHGIRARWADETNVALKASGSASLVDHRSYKKRGIDKSPGRHRGADPVERSYKRERATLTQTSEGHLMPTQDEKQHYPLLTQRDVWPPASPYPEQAMSEGERTELKAYFEARQERTLGQAQPSSEGHEARTRQPEERSLGDSQPAQGSPWYEQALERAKGQQAQEKTAGVYQERVDYAQEIGWMEERSVQNAEERKDLVRRALNMHRDADEHRLIESVRHRPAHIRQHVQRTLFEARIDRLKHNDEQHRLAEFERKLEPSLRDNLRSAVQSIRGSTEDHHREEHLPVPDPDRNPISPQERDEAERKMQQDYERETER